MGSSHGRFRVALYAYSNVGSGGFMKSAYQFLERRWASYRDTSGQTTISGARAEHQSVRKFCFDWGVVVPINGLIVVLSDGQCFRVLSVNDAPAVRKHIATAVWVDSEIVRRVEALS